MVLKKTLVWSSNFCEPSFVPLYRQIFLSLKMFLSFYQGSFSAAASSLAKIDSPPEARLSAEINLLVNAFYEGNKRSALRFMQRFGSVKVPAGKMRIVSSCIGWVE